MIHRTDADGASSVLMVIMMLILGYLYPSLALRLHSQWASHSKILFLYFFAHSILKKLIATHINHFSINIMYKKIYLVGAFDRHNYGDILFSIDTF